MKSLGLICVITACFVLPVGRVRTTPEAKAGQCDSQADAHAISAISDAWKEGYNHGQAAQVASLYTDDAYYLTQHFVSGIVHPRQLIQAYVQKGVDAHYQIDSIETLSTYCSGNFAYAITRYHSTNAGQTAMGVNLVVLRKIDGKWLIVAHESAVPDPATAIQTLGPTTH